MMMRLLRIAALLYLVALILSIVTISGMRNYLYQNQGVMNSAQFENPIISVVDAITAVNDGRKEHNFGGGNLGAYYNFMYPDNTDYPWACKCNEEDLAAFRRKELPYARCRNQEDLSYQDLQANCDPRNVTNFEVYDKEVNLLPWYIWSNPGWNNRGLWVCAGCRLRFHEQIFSENFKMAIPGFAV